MKDRTIILWGNDFVARKVIIALKELGYSVPDDTTVIGYDGGKDATDESPSITTFYQDKEYLGEIAVRLLTKPSKKSLILI